MANRRKTRGKGRSPISASLVVLAAFCAVVLVWVLVPRHSGKDAQTPAISQETPQPAATSVETEAPQTPSESASATPQSNASVQPEGTGPEVAIIVDDCGQWPVTERGYIALPIALTMSVMPHVPYGHEIAQEAADAGKGVMLHLPMEPVSHINPGAGKITTDMSDDAIVAQTEDDLAQVPLAKGVNNHEGSAASADTRVMHDVIGVVKDRGLFFVDSMTSAKSVAAQTAASAGVPNASRDVFLDNKADVAYTESMLEQTVAVAREHGSAIAIGHPRPTTLEALREMYPKMQAEGIRFVLVSDLVH